MAEPGAPLDAPTRPSPTDTERHDGDGASRPAVTHPPAEANPNLLRDRLANERTFLAWLRTGIAVTSLGFVVARFDIFLQQLAQVGSDTGALAPEAAGKAAEGTAAVPIGLILVLAGPAMVLLAAVRYLHTERALHLGRSDSRRLVRTIVIVISAISVIAGVALALHLIAVWPK